jgi:hypothetical protein
MGSDRRHVQFQPARCRRPPHELGEWFDSVRSGASFAIENDTHPPLPGRAIQADDLRKYAGYLAVIGPEAQFRPKEWNGVYRIEGVMRWNVVSEGVRLDYRLRPLATYPDS